MAEELTKAQQKAKELINQKITHIVAMLGSIRDCLEKNDFFQASVRLAEISKDAKFDDEVMELFECLSDE